MGRTNTGMTADGRGDKGRGLVVGVFLISRLVCSDCAERVWERIKETIRSFHGQIGPMKREDETGSMSLNDTDMTLK